MRMRQLVSYTKMWGLICRLQIYLPSVGVYFNERVGHYRRISKLAWVLRNALMCVGKHGEKEDDPWNECMQDPLLRPLLEETTALRDSLLGPPPAQFSSAFSAGRTRGAMSSGRRKGASSRLPRLAPRTVGRHPLSW